MKSGTWQDEPREANAFTILDKPRSAPLIQFYLLDTLSCGFLVARGHTNALSRPRAGSDRQGQKKHTPRAPRTGGRGSANTITVVHNMQGVLKCLTSCQEKVPGLVSATNLARQGSDSLAAADRTRQVQPDTLSLPRIHCRPLFYSLSSHLRLSSQVLPCVCVCFGLLSLIANLLFLCGDAACTQR